MGQGKSDHLCNSYTLSCLGLTALPFAQSWISLFRRIQSENLSNSLSTFITLLTWKNSTIVKVDWTKALAWSEASLLSWKYFGGPCWIFVRIFPGGSEVKVSACNAGDLGWILGSGRSSGEGNGNPLQYSCLENPMDGGAWWATVHGVVHGLL